MTQLKSRKNRGFRRGVGGVCGFVMRFAALCALSQQRKYNFFCEIQRQKTRILEDSYIFLIGFTLSAPPYFTPCGGCFGDRAGWTSFLLRENTHKGGYFCIIYKYSQLMPHKFQRLRLIRGKILHDYVIATRSNLSALRGSVSVCRFMLYKITVARFAAVLWAFPWLSAGLLLYNILPRGEF